MPLHQAQIHSGHSQHSEEKLTAVWLQRVQLISKMLYGRDGTKEYYIDKKEQLRKKRKGVKQQVKQQ